jgi:hypothetical protein
MKQRSSKERCGDRQGEGYESLRIRDHCVWWLLCFGSATLDQTPIEQQVLNHCTRSVRITLGKRSLFCRSYYACEYFNSLLVLLILSLTSELDGFLSTFNPRTFLITTLDGGKGSGGKDVV